MNTIYLFTPIFNVPQHSNTKPDTTTKKVFKIISITVSMKKAYRNLDNHF